jgi:hypothetical protein
MDPELIPCHRLLPCLAPHLRFAKLVMHSPLEAGTPTHPSRLKANGRGGLREIWKPFIVDMPEF